MVFRFLHKKIYHMCTEMRQSLLVGTTELVFQLCTSDQNLFDCTL